MLTGFSQLEWNEFDVAVIESKFLSGYYTIELGLVEHGRP